MLFLMPLVILAQPSASVSAINQAPASLQLDRNLMGMVARDPWYEYGTHPDYPNQPNYIAQERMGQILSQLGVRWVRIEFRVNGSDVESQIARNDYFINNVAPRYDLKVLGLLSFGLVAERDPLDPRFGLVATSTFTDPAYGGGVNDYMRTWLDRARAVVSRYKGKIAAYEILNEQNRLNAAGEGISATVAARLHTKFYRFFRQVDRDAGDDQEWRDNIYIVLGGLHPKGTGKPGSKDYVSDREYVRQSYASDGFVSYRQTYGQFPIDGLGYHPYPEEIRLSLQSDMDLITSRMQEMRNLLATELDDPLRPFWITEIGYNVAFGRQTERGQVDFMRAVYTTLAARGDVATIFWFKYEDFPPASGPNAQQWGVVSIPFTESADCPGGACYDVAGEPERWRPSFWTYRELSGVSEAPVERVFLPIVHR